MLTKAFIGEALSFTSLLLAESGKNGSTERTVDVIGASSGALTKRALIKI